MSSAPMRWKPTANLTISDIRDVTADLRAAVEAGGNVELDLREVQAVDVAGVQLLSALRHTITRAGNAVSILAERGGAFETALIGIGFLNAEGKARSAEEQMWADYLKEGAIGA